MSEVGGREGGRDSEGDGEREREREKEEEGVSESCTCEKSTSPFTSLRGCHPSPPNPPNPAHQLRASARPASTSNQHHGKREREREKAKKGEREHRVEVKRLRNTEEGDMGVLISSSYLQNSCKTDANTRIHIMP